MTSQAMTTARDAQAAVATGSIRAVAGGDAATMRRTVHPDAVNRESYREPPATRGRGPEAFLATSAWLRAAFSDLFFTFDLVLVEDDVVVTDGTMSGRHTGSLVVYDEDGAVERAFAPTGRRFEVHHAHFLRMRDGMVVEHWAVRDDQAMAMQLGWVPPSPAYLLRCALATARARRVTG